MEDMARLALVEQNLRNRNNFSVILLELLQLIKTILDNPHDYELRTVNNDVLVKVLDCEAFDDYLKYVGFEKVIYIHIIIYSQFRKCCALLVHRQQTKRKSLSNKLIIFILNKIISMIRINFTFYWLQNNLFPPLLRYLISFFSYLSIKLFNVYFLKQVLTSTNCHIILVNIQINKQAVRVSYDSKGKCFLCKLLILQVQLKQLRRKQFKFKFLNYLLVQNRYIVYP